MKDRTVRIMKALLNLAPHLAISALFILIVWGCGAIPQLKEGSAGAYVRLPFVRVLIDNTSPEMTIAGESSFTLEVARRHANRAERFLRPLTIL